MSILVEIAEQADVPVEGVIRVLTREPVSDSVLARVLAVLDELTPEQTRAVQRFALAALHDVLPRPSAADEEGMANDEIAVHEDQLTLSAAAEPEEPAAQPPAPSPPEAALVQLKSVLSELAEAVRDLRRETDAERRERVDDLAVVIDLITTGWQGLDARLGRIEKQVARIDASRRSSAAPLTAPTAVPAAAVPVGRGPAAPGPGAPAAERIETQPSGAAESDRRSGLLPLAAVLTLAGAVIGTFAVLQLTSKGPDVAALVSAREASTQTGVGSSSTTGAPTTTTPATTTPATTTPATKTTATKTPATTSTAARPPATPTTSSVLGTTVGSKPAPRKPPARTTTTPPAAPAPSFKPTRNWAWAPVPNADYYSVEFTRGGKAFYKATPNEPRLTLPDTVVFVPGVYRWVIRAGFGPKTSNRLGPPVVNSGFTVS